MNKDSVVWSVPVCILSAVVYIGNIFDKLTYNLFKNKHMMTLVCPWVRWIMYINVHTHTHTRIRIIGWCRCFLLSNVLIFFSFHFTPSQVLNCFHLLLLPVKLKLKRKWFALVELINEHKCVCVCCHSWF